MRRILNPYLLLTLVVTAAHAAPLLKNADFTERGADDAVRPVAWTVPADSAWHVTNEDGSSGQDALRYRSRTQEVVGPVTQEITLVANTDYVLTAALKGTATLHPLVRIRAADAAAQEVVRLESRMPSEPPSWKAHQAVFTSGKTIRAVVEIWADVRQLQGKPAPGGTIAVDDVQVVTATEHAQQNAAAGQKPAYENVALNRPYTMSPQPTYSLCTDAGDKTQLTDGQYTVGYFWTQKTTVGWSRARPVVITIDLGVDAPIRGLSYNTAAGVAGVTWPASVMALISADGSLYHEVGDLVVLSRKNGLPTDEKYSIHRFSTDDLKTHGRFIKLFIDPSGPYCFIDEIEVYRGEDSWVNLPLPGNGIRYPHEYYEDNIFNAAIKRRIGLDLVKAQEFVEDSDLSAAAKQRLMARAPGIEEGIADLPQYDQEGFRAVFPLNDVHASVFAIHGAVRRAQGKQPLVAWGANQWDFLAHTELPDTPPEAKVTVAAMRGETRSGAVNVTNCTEKAVNLDVTINGLPGGSRPKYTTLHGVAWTDTLEGTPVAAALPIAPKTQEGWQITVPAGMTRQIWLSVTPDGISPGTHQGTLVLSDGPGGTIRVPLELRVFDLDFPKKPMLHVGGWDYTDAKAQYGVTPENRESLVAHLRERFVDSPWATSGVMPTGSFNEDGTHRVEPDTTRFDAWVELWAEARRYCVFNAVRDNIAGAKIGTPEFAPRVESWIRFWVKHARSLDIEPDRLVLLLVDEPHANAQDETIIAWAEIIQATEPGVQIFEDPTYRDPTEALSEMMAITDILCPNRPMMLAQGKEFEQFYHDQKQAGRRLEFYSCSGPGKLLDPYAYHRLQAWTCFEFGAEASSFWAFGDTGGGDSWNEYATKRTSYTPVFLSATETTAGKHMEAIRESVQDYEILVLLRKQVEKYPNHPLAGKARRLLTEGVRRVLADASVEALTWREPKNRSIADQVRIETAELLEKLK